MQLRRLDSPEGVVVQLAMRNGSSRRYWVRKSWPSSDEDAPHTVYPVWFDVYRVPPVPNHRDRSYGFVTERPRYAILGPGESQAQEYNLASADHFPSEGCYRIRAFYRDTAAEEPRRPRDVRRLPGVLVSNLLETYVTLAQAQPFAAHSP
jgi:hypothetical protein